MTTATKLNSLLALAALTFGFLPSTVEASDVQRFIRTLKGSGTTGTSQYSNQGNYRSQPSASPYHQPSNRYQPQRGGTNTRSMSFSSPAAVPSSLQSAASQNMVSVQPRHGGGAQVSYCVDGDSRLTTDDILFLKASTQFADRYSYEIVRDLAYAMMSPELRGFQFVIEGHASADGSDATNQRLSQRRAERIAAEMVRLGVNPWQIVAVGYGESEARHPEFAPEYLLTEDRKVVVYRLDR